MNRKQHLGLLKEHKPTSAERFGVTELALFGSVTRDDADDESDADILVQIRNGPATSQRNFGVQCPDIPRGLA